MHNIHHADYPLNVNKKSVQTEWDQYAAHEDWQEGCTGLDKNIRWIESPVYETYEEAEKAIEKLDKGWYDQLAVKYKDNIPLTTKSEKLKELEQKVSDAYKEYDKRSSALYVKTRTSEYIGCSACRSRLSSKHLVSNRCPVCHADLRPETTLKLIAAAETKWKKAQQAIKEYIDKHSKKEVRWLVKIEYHT